MSDPCENDAISLLPKKSLPDIQGAFSTRSASSSSLTNLPSLSPPQNSSDNDPIFTVPPTWERKTWFSVDSDVNAVRAQEDALSRAMSWSIDALRLLDIDSMTPHQREAFDCLVYVRNSLSDLSQGKVIQLDEDKLRPTAYQTQDGQENKGLASVPPVSPMEPDAPRVMLSKRDSKPLAGLTRTPQAPVPPLMPQVSASPSSRGPPRQKGTTFSAPATMNRFASTQIISPTSHLSPDWQRLSSGSAGTDVSREPQNNDYSASSGYPPKRADSHSPGSRAATVTIDPLGVLK